jgi:hypothetical protein
MGLSVCQASELIIAFVATRSRDEPPSGRLFRCPGDRELREVGARKAVIGGGGGVARLVTSRGCGSPPSAPAGCARARAASCASPPQAAHLVGEHLDLAARRHDRERLGPLADTPTGRLVVVSAVLPRCGRPQRWAENWCSGSRTRGGSKISARQIAALYVESVSEYQASGGTSRVFKMDEDEQLQIEVHKNDYAVLWPTMLSDSDISARLGGLLPQTCRRGIVHVEREDSHRIYELSGQETREFIDGIHSELGPLDFVRIDYDDRVLTWEGRQGDGGRSNEIGFLAEQFDPSYLVALVTSTATRPVIGIAEQAIYGAADIVGRFPSQSLFPDEASIG